MTLTSIVIATYKPEYLATLERVFVREYQFTAEIVLLPDEKSLKQYFAEPKTIDILLISEELYDQSFVRHNVSHLFILTEEEPNAETAGELFNNMLYMYSNGKTIIDNVVSRTGISHATNMHSGVAKVIMVYSPVGGVGKTTLAAGVCTLVARNFRRALFVGTDDLQTFGYIMKGQQRLLAGTEKTLQQKSKYTFDKIKPMLAQELFDIIPPFPAALASLGVTQDHMMFLIDQIKNSGDYDYIIVDGGSDFSDATTRMMSHADQVLLITAQDENSMYKLHCLLDNIDCSDANRFALVCNKYQQNAESFLVADGSRSYPQLDYIEYDPMISPKDGDYLANMQSMQKLGQFFL
jgi:ATPases involved in chromosome partitioning